MKSFSSSVILAATSSALLIALVIIEQLLAVNLFVDAALPSTITASVTISDISGKRLQKMPDVTFQQQQTNTQETNRFSLSPTNSTSVEIIPQSIVGFGGSFMRAGAFLFSQLSTTTQDNLMKDLFDPVDGAAFTVAKIPIGATDFGVPVWYTYLQPDGNFSIDWDLQKENGTIPFIKKAFAAAGKTLKVEATLDYGPARWFDKSTKLPKASFDSKFYPQLAQYFIDFFTSFEDAGVPIAYLDCYNEPFESYQYENQQQVASFMKYHMGPAMAKFRKENPGRHTPKLTFGAQYGREISYSDWMDFMLNDAELLQYIEVVMVHGYDDHFTCTQVPEDPENHIPANSFNTTVPKIKKAFSDFKKYIANLQNAKFKQDPLNYNKSSPLLAFMSEVCYATEFNNYPNETLAICPNIPRSDFLDSMQWGRMLFGDLDAGASYWQYWNLLLDLGGGPWLTSPEHNDPDGNVQQPLVIVDTKSDKYTLTGCYYAMAHFSKFVRPGMNKVGDFARSADLPENVYGIAFAGEDENDKSKTRFVLIFMNDRPESFNISISLFADQLSLSTSTDDSVFTLPSVSFATIVFSVDSNEVSLDKMDIPPSSTNNKKPADDVNALAPVLGTLGALIMVAVIVVLFVRTQKHKQQQQQFDTTTTAAETGEYKQMA